MNAGQTLFRMVRGLTKSLQSQESAEHQLGRLAMTMEAVSDAAIDGWATINDIAEEMGIDQSGASRLISQAITAGYVVRERSITDGRARQCRLTSKGKDLLLSSRAWQEEVFDSLTHDWTQEERAMFASMMERILDASRESGKT